MRIIDIPPYQRAGVNYDPKEGHFMMKELVSYLKSKGQLDGVEIDIDEGAPTDHGAESRDEEVVSNIAVGVVNRVKAVCAMGKYDAVITQAGIEPGFLAAHVVSTLPIAYPVHSAMHFASLLGEKFCVLTTTDAQAMIERGENPTPEMEEQLDALLSKVQVNPTYQRVLVANDNYEKIMQQVNQWIMDGIRKGATSSIITLG